MLYRTIVADPPWQVTTGRPLGLYVKDGDRQLFGPRSQKSRNLSYSSMSVEEISALPIPADTDAHLYLWTINKYLDSAFDVLRNWGFTYSTTIVWAKRPMGGGLGGCFGLATEFCLFGRKGRLASRDRIGRNWFDWKRPYDERGKPKHSAKPPEFMDMIERVSPGPYLEMFARTHRAGWDSWGDQCA